MCPSLFGGQGLEDGSQSLNWLVLAADHQAIAHRQSPNSAAGSHIDVVNSFLFQFGGATGPLFTVVGIVGDISDASLKSVPRPQVYFSSQQTMPRSVSFVVRYDGPLTPVMTGMRRIVSTIDPKLPLYDVQTVEDVLLGASRSERFTTMLLSAFSFLALVLAALGTYGVIAQGVSERTREIGVRIALGATGANVRGMVLREGLTLIALALPTMAQELHATPSASIWVVNAYQLAVTVSLLNCCSDHMPYQNRGVPAIMCRSSPASGRSGRTS